jgi:hypothetical protein
MSMYLVTGHFRKPYFCTLNNITKVQEWHHFTVWGVWDSLLRQSTHVVFPWQCFYCLLSRRRPYNMKGVEPYETPGILILKPTQKLAPASAFWHPSFQPSTRPKKCWTVSPYSSNKGSGIGPDSGFVIIFSFILVVDWPNIARILTVTFQIPAYIPVFKLLCYNLHFFHL